MLGNVGVIFTFAINLKPHMPETRETLLTITFCTRKAATTKNIGIDQLLLQLPDKFDTANSQLLGAVLINTQQDPPFQNCAIICTKS